MIKVSKACCGEEELNQVKEAFDYGYFGLAYKVNEFEQEVQKYLGTTRHVVAVVNGTAALRIALDACGIGEGDEVILPSFTFVATVQAVIETGATPVFCDIHRDTFLVDVEDIKKRITKRTKAIIPVHYAGDVCDMDALLELKTKYGIRIIEDAAHAFGSSYHGKKVGSFGDITCFSYDSIKPMTCGEGGTVVVNEDDLDDLIRVKRLLGIDRKTMHTTDWKKRSWKYDVPVQGYRYHMSNINAGIGLAQIKKLNGFIARRREIAHKYIDLLSDVKGIVLPNNNIDEMSSFMFVIKVLDGKRDQLKSFFMENDIETGISYIPIHSFSLFKKEGFTLPVTEEIYEEILSLPMHVGLSNDDIELVCAKIHEFFK